MAENMQYTLLVEAFVSLGLTIRERWGEREREWRARERSSGQLPLPFNFLFKLSPISIF